MIMIQKITLQAKKRILPWKGEAKHALKKIEICISRVNGKVHAALTTLPKTTVIYKVVIK